MAKRRCKLIYLSFLYKFQKKIEIFSSGILSKISKLEHENKTNADVEQYLNDAIEDISKFKSLPEEASKSILLDDSEFKHAIYLYFLTKQVIAIYESKIERIPLQIYNEMRNALDHYFRSILIIEDNEEEQKKYRDKNIKRLEGHIQRALLDVVKLTCAAIIDNVRFKNKKFGEKAIMLVNHGEFYKELASLIKEAELSLVDAKYSEYIIGRNNKQDLDSTDKYLKALIFHLKVDEFYKDSLKNLYWGKAKVYILSSAQFASGIIVAVVAKFVWDILEDTPVVVFFKNYASNILS